MAVFYFITIVFVCLVFILTRGYKIVYKVLLLVVVLGMAFFIYNLFLAKPLTHGPNDLWYEIAPWKQILLIVSMLFGMISNSLLEYLQARIKAKESKGKVKKPRLIWEKFALPMIISALVFGYIWAHYGQQSISVNSIIFSFQNGFFWQTVLEKVR